jgi:hypothetical protein
VLCCAVLLALLQERIAELEAEAMGERPWQLKGEVASEQRPLNSALEVRGVGRQRRCLMCLTPQGCVWGKSDGAGIVRMSGCQAETH